MTFQLLLSQLDYIRILSDMNLTDTITAVSAKRIFEFSFNSLITSTTHANLNMTSIHMIDHGFYIQTQPSTIYQFYGQDIFNKAVRAASHELGDKITGRPIPGNVRFKIEFIKYLKSEKSIDINVLDFLMNPPLKQE